MSSFSELAWEVDEPTYRADSAISYSDISQFLSWGDMILEHWKEPKKSYGLSLGSVLDCLVTEGLEVFAKKYLITQFNPENKGEQLIAKIFNYIEAKSLEEAVKDNGVQKLIAEDAYYSNRTPSSKIASLLKSSGYWNDLVTSQRDNKVLVSYSMYEDANEMLNKLRGTKLTNNLLFNSVPNGETFNQFKVKVSIEGIDFRCMIDRLLVAHSTKAIYMIDLKSTSSPMSSFLDSFVHWNYHIQTRLYRRILKERLKGTQFQDYEIFDYIYVVVNKDEDPIAFKITLPDEGDIVVSNRRKDYYFPDPVDKGIELHNLIVQQSPSAVIELNPDKLNSLLSPGIRTINN